MDAILTLGVLAIIGCFLIWWVGNAIIRSYFEAKAEFVDRLIEKQKGASDGEE